MCVNAMSEAERHGPIPLPTHKQVIRRMLAYRSSLGPLVPILLKKEDVDGAFTLIDVAAEDVPTVATDMGFKPGDLGDGGQAIDVETVINASTPAEVATALRAAGAKAAAVIQRTQAAAGKAARGRGALKRVAAASASLFTLVYLTGTFGHRGMPAQFGRLASTPIGNYFDGHVAAVTKINGPWPFSCYVYVDDAVDVCPDVGLAESSSRPQGATCIKVCLSPSDFSYIPSLPRSRGTFPRALLRRVAFTCRHNRSQTLVAAFT